MPYRPPAVALMLLAVLVLPATGFAQESKPFRLEAGTWSGVVTPPNEEAVNVTYDVAYTGDTLAITINAAQHGMFKAEDIFASAEKVTFYFTPGPRVTCVLKAVDTGGYAGECTDEGGMGASMTMLPPKKDTKS